MKNLVSAETLRSEVVDRSLLFCGCEVTGCGGVKDGALDDSTSSFVLASTLRMKA